MTQEKHSFLNGVKAALPIAASLLPFAAVAAVSAQEAGLSIKHTLGLSLLVFGGAAQLTVAELERAHAPVALILLAVGIVNLRFLIYGAQLSPHVRKHPPGLRVLIAYLMTDQSYALSLPRLEGGSGVRFFFGVATPVWSAWQLGTLVGIALGDQLPAVLALDFTVALAFVALFVPHLKGKPDVAAALVSTLSFLLLRDLPYGSGLLLSSTLGVGVGYRLERGAP